MRRATVLSVDDNPANRYVRARALRRAGFEVIESGTGEGALKLAREMHPDLVLLDIKLPDMSGLEVCRTLRRDPQVGGVAIVHISATYLDIETESLDAGADIYLAEPVEPQELMSAVTTLLRLRRAEDRLVASEERMRLAMEAAGIATWDADVATGDSVWSERLYSIMGLDPARTPATLPAWLERIVPEDRDAVVAAFHHAQQQGTPISIEHWIMRADDGERRCVSVHGMLRASDENVPRRLIGVAIDITERKRAEAEREALLRQAQAAQRAAEEAGRVKDEFLAVLSHELRTPMTAMLGWLHVLRSGRLRQEQEPSALETIERNALLQMRLVNDLLDVSSIVAGKMKLDLMPLHLEQVLLAAIDSHRPAAAARSVELRVDIAPGVSIVQGSPERLGQVFNNLLANAVKFTPPGGRIDVSLERSAEEVCVEVADTGQGIPAELLPRLFQRFWQADTSIRRRHGGLGLGLAIVRSLVEMHAGSVQAASAGPGRGASFRVRLPLLPPRELPADPHAAPQRAPDSLNGMRVLVVDDEPDALQMVTRILELEGAAVKSAAGGEEAWNLASRWTPHVLLLDLGMPGEDGYSLLKRLRALYPDAASAPPAIALTGFAGEDVRRRVLESGFRAHLPKPFRIDQLIDAIRTATAAG